MHHRMEASITAIEDGLDGLHGEVDQQAEQSSLLQKKLLLTEERGTVLYCTVLYCTVLYCTVLYCTVLYCTVLYCTVL